MDNKDKWIILEDDTKAWPGDVVYNYYDMWPGIIITESVNDRDFDMWPGLNRNQDIWVRVKRIDGQDAAILNGQRLCSPAFAARRGFRDADVAVSAVSAGMDGTE